MAIPTGRTPQVAAFLIPGVNLNNVDVGGTNIINTTGGSLSVHGGSISDTRLLIDGVTIANTEGTGWSANMLPNMGEHAGSRDRLFVYDRREHHGRPQDQHDPEDRRQPVFRDVVRDRGQFRVRRHEHRRQLVARGLRTPNSLKHQSDVNPGFRRPAEARHAVVLHVGTFHASGELRRRAVQEPERRRHHQMDLRRRPGSSAPSTMPPSKASTSG